MPAWLFVISVNTFSRFYIYANMDSGSIVDIASFNALQLIVTACDSLALILNKCIADYQCIICHCVLCS